MGKVDVNSVKKSTSAIIVERGATIYNKNLAKVEAIQDSFLSTEVKADVKDLQDNSYKVIFEVDDKGNCDKFQCDCYKFKSFKRKKPCEHIVASIFEYDNTNKRLLPSNSFIISSNTHKNVTNYSKGVSDTKESVIEAVKTYEASENECNDEGASLSKESNFLKDKLELLLEIVSYKNTKDTYFAVNLWIGDKKFYKVSDIKGFFYEYKNKNHSIKVNKNFQYDSKNHTFSSGNKKILNIIMESEKSTFNEIRKKEFKANEIVFLKEKELCEILRLWDKKLILFNNGSARKKVPIINDNLPLKIEILKANTFVKIKHLEELPIKIDSQGEFFYYKGCMYKPGRKQIEAYMPFYRELEEENEDTIVVYKDLNELAFENVFTNIEKSSAEIIVKDEVLYKNKLDSLKVRFDLDFQNEKIYLTLLYQYDDGEIDPFSQQKYDISKKIRNRDLKKEEYIFNIIKGLNFTRYNKGFQLTEEREIVKFLEKGILQLEEFGEVYKSQDFEELKIIKPSDYSTNVVLNKNSLLEFTFNIQGVSSYDVNGIIKAIQDGQNSYFIGKGKYVDLNDRSLNNVTDLINFMDVKSVNRNTNTIITSKYSALYIDKALKSNNIKVKGNKDYFQLVNEVIKGNNSNITVSEELNSKLRGYQKEGFNWLKSIYDYGFGGILADEMGLGKTIQAISLIDAYVKEKKDDKKDKKPVLVVCPAALIYNWVHEIEKFAPYLKTVVIYGEARERIKNIEELEDEDVIITSYTTLSKDINSYVTKEFSICIIDEAQNIKNPRSLVSKMIKAVPAECRLALTGTPIENNLEELWSIFDFIMPGYLLSNKDFLNRYVIPINENSKKALEALNRHIQPFILRRYKKDVTKELPDKIEKTIRLELSEKEKEVYMAYNAILKNEIIDKISMDGFNKSKIHLLGGLSRLKQICCDPKVVLPTFDGESSKIIALHDILEESLAIGNRVIIFSQYTKVLNSIGNSLKAKDIEYFYLDGQTPSKERMELTKRFNEGEREVFLLSLKAGGTGLNLTGANVVVHFDLWWNPAVEAQATDRAHRIGQEKKVEVIKLVTKGTIEEKIIEIQKRKKFLIENVIDDSEVEKSFIADMTIEEVKDLFS